MEICELEKYVKYFSTKYNIKSYGYEFEDLRSIVYEVYCQCLSHYKQDKGATFQTYLVKSINNAFIDILKAEYGKPLNCSNDIELYEISDRYLIDEWVNVRDIISEFHGVFRVIVKEIIDPSDEVMLSMKAIVYKHMQHDKFSLKRGYTHRRHAYRDLLKAIMLTYGISKSEFKEIVAFIRNKINCLHCFS